MHLSSLPPCTHPPCLHAPTLAPLLPRLSCAYPRSLVSASHTLFPSLALTLSQGKKKVIAETGAGQHGVALAAAAALMRLECEIHMGEIDIRKEWPNVRRMQVLGAKVVPATAGGKSLKEAVDSAFGAFMGDPNSMFFAIGSTVGPHPFPMMVRAQRAHNAP